MTPLQLTVSAVAGLTLAATAAAPDAPRGPVAPAATAVVVQSPAACAPFPSPSRRVLNDLARREAIQHSTSRRVPASRGLPAAARRLQAEGADVRLVCDAESATAAVVRAAATHTAILGSGPDVRAALSLAATDHPGQRFGPLPGR